MKKFFSLMIALVVALAINATDYYFAGAANGWSNSSASYKFEEVEGVLTLEVADLYGEFKVTENGSWHPQHGAAAGGEGVAFGGSYNLVKCDDSQGDADAPANCNILMPETEFAEPRYKDAKLTLDASDPDHIVINFVAGTLYDHAAAPKTYQIVGIGGNWDLSAAPQFEAVDGVLTVEVAELVGTFKIVEDRAWTNQWATNWDTKAGLAFGVPYVLGAKGEQGEPANLALANPFGSYKNAKLTLEISEEVFTLTLVEGTFDMAVADWYLPGTKLGWNCNNDTKFDEKADGIYQLLLPEINADFKVVYGDWMVEFGSAKGKGETWTIGEKIALSTPCDNLYPTDGEATYTDVYVTIFVDYESVDVQLLISQTDPMGVENTTISEKAVKRVINGQMVIEKNGVRYNAVGAKL